ncbi:MAG: hypothetical protein KGQ93_08360 [Cyanobacteria bacterium REEB459]|nr:hypothetical protein [Cyanobacteria bacterium REEB459]
MLGLVGIGKQSGYYLELPEQEATAAPVTPAPATAAPVVAAPVTPALVTPSLATVATPATPAIANFATTYLMAPGAVRPSRRRPGPSLSGFLDMAKQVKAS